MEVITMRRSMTRNERLSYGRGARARVFALGLAALGGAGCGAGAAGEETGLAEEAVSSFGGLAWVAQGPAPMRNGQGRTLPFSDQNPVAGAVRSLAAHPTNANILYAGTANGGVWRTTNALAQDPSWTPLTDFQPSLAIGAVALDRNDSQTLVAGTGCFSSFDDCGSPPGQVLVSHNGGASFTLITDPLFAGASITGAVIRGSVLVVSYGELARSTDGGQTWTRLTGLPNVGLPFLNGVVNLVEDIQTPNRLYLTQLRGGVYRSDDLGATWVNISQNDPGSGGLNAAILGSPGAANVGVCQDGRAYVGVTDTFQSVIFVGYTVDGGHTWTHMDLPGVPIRPNPFFHFALAGDRPNSSFVYVMGISSPMRGNAGIAPTGQTPSPQWAPLDGAGTPNGTSPHVDSRAMVFDANLDLISSSDGGVFRRVRPRETTGDWFSLAGNMQDAEIHDVAYDANARVVMAGTQDNGTVYQLTPGQVPWTTFSGGDGGDVQVDVTTMPGFSIRYSSFQNFGGFTRATFNANNVEVASVSPALTVVGGGAPPTFLQQFVTPLELNRANPHRLVFGADQAVYESFDQGNTIASLGAAGEATAMAYGHPANPDVLYVAASRVFVRLSAGAPLAPTPTPFPVFPQDVVIDGADFHRAYVIGQFPRVFVTPDAGSTWTEITGNLQTLNPGLLRAIEFVPGASRGIIVVSGNSGVFATTTSALGTWQRVGSNLPLSPVLDMQYSPQQDLLVAGLLGRGAWSVHGLAGQ
jgi:photosystem II stability/assembly factor-like uncharacterized protein